MPVKTELSKPLVSLEIVKPWIRCIVQEKFQQKNEKQPPKKALGKVTKNLQNIAPVFSDFSGGFGIQEEALKLAIGGSCQGLSPPGEAS